MNIVTRPRGTTARTKDSNTKKFAKTSTLPSTLSIKEARILPRERLPSSQFAGFPNKVANPCPNNLSLNLLACCAVSRENLGSVSKHFESGAPAVAEGDWQRLGRHRIWV